MDEHTANVLLVSTLPINPVLFAERPSHPTGAAPWVKSQRSSDTEQQLESKVQDLPVLLSAAGATLP